MPRIRIKAWKNQRKNRPKAGKGFSSLSRGRIELHADAVSPSSPCGAVRKYHYRLTFHRSFCGSHPSTGDRCRKGLSCVARHRVPVLAVLPVQPASRFVQIFRCVTKAEIFFLKIVDNSRCNGYYRIKHFGFFQGAWLFEVKGSLLPERTFCFTSTNMLKRCRAFRPAR